MAQGEAGRLDRRSKRTLVGVFGHRRHSPLVAGRTGEVELTAPLRAEVPLFVPVRVLLGVMAQTPFQRFRSVVHHPQALVHAPRGLARPLRTPPDPFRTFLRCPVAIPISHAHILTTRSRRLGCYPEFRRRAGRGPTPSRDGASLDTCIILSSRLPGIQPSRAWLSRRRRVLARSRGCLTEGRARTSIWRELREPGQRRERAKHP